MSREEIFSATMEVDQKDLTIEGYVHYHTEVNYGADADGRRGERRTFVDDITRIQAYDPEGEEVRLTRGQEEQAAQILKEKFLEE